MNSTYIEYIGWTLIHSTWLLLVIGQLFVFADALTRRASAKWRYRLSLCTMLLMATVPAAAMAYVVSTTKVATAVSPSQFEPVSVVVPEVSPSANLIAQVPETTTVSEAVDELNVLKAQESNAEQVIAQHQSESASWFVQVHTAIKSRLSEIVYAWLCGLALFGLRPVIGLRQMSRLRRSGRSQLPTWVEDLGVETAQRFRMRVVEMSASTLVQVPTVVGFLRPVILLPGSMITGLNAEQLRAVIAHELAHVKRMDTFVRVFQVALETVFFYHPMVWWVSRRMNEEREHCCDDLAIQVTEDRLSYSRMLLTVEELRGTTPSMAVAASGGSLLSRIQRIVGTKPEDAPTPKLLVTLLALLVVAAAAPLMETRETFAKESEQVDDEISEQTRILDQLRSLGVQFGNNHGHLVKELQVHNCAESACWPLIAQLETLESLKIWGTEFTAQEARHIEALKRLRSLEIANCRNVTPDVLKSIGKLKNLEELRVMFNVFSNDKEENLKRLGALTDDEASLLEDISGPERKKLHIAVSTIWMDRALPQLKGLKKLRTLELLNSFMSDVGLGHLHPLRKLESLQISGTTFSEKALQKFVPSHPQLRKLSRWNANDADLEILAELKHLEELDVWAGDVTDKGAASLAKMTKLKRLDINGHQMTDDGLKHLSALDNLERLMMRHLSGPATDDGIAAMQNELPPDCLIHYSFSKSKEPSSESLPDWAQFEEIPNWFTPDPYPEAGYSETKGDAWNWFRLVKFARVELGLSQQRADQFALLYDLAPDRFKGVTHLLNGKPFAISVLDEWRRHDVDPRMKASTRQLERLDQLLLQKKGREFFIGDEAPHAMALTPKQHQDLKDAVSRYQERIREFAPKETVHIRQAAYRRLWFDFHEILTPQQRERYRQLRGPLEKQDLSRPPKPKMEIPPARELTVLVGQLQGRVLAIVDADPPATLDDFDFDSVESKESTVVVVSAEKDVPAADIQRIIERLKEAGFEKFSLKAIKDGESAANQRGVVYEFGASWSAPSRQMSTIVDKLKQEGLPIQKVDIDQQQHLVKQFEIEGVPTFVLVIDGQEVDRVIGKVKEAELRRMMERISESSGQTHDEGVMQGIEVQEAVEETLDLPKQATIVIGRRDGEVLVVVNDQPAVELSGFGTKHLSGIVESHVVIYMETSITASDAKKLTKELESHGFSKYVLRAENKSDTFWEKHAPQREAAAGDNEESVIVLGRPRESNGNLLANEIFAVIDDQEPVILEQLSAENLDVAMDKLVVIQAEEKIPLKDMQRLIVVLEQKEIADIQVSLWREAVIPNHQAFPAAVNGPVDVFVGYFNEAPSNQLQVTVAGNTAPFSEYAKLLDKHVPSHREVLIRIQPSVPFEAIQQFIELTSEYEFKSVNLTGAYSLSSVMQPMPVKVGYLRIGSREVRTAPYVFCYQKSAKLKNSTQFFKDLFDQRVKNLGVRLAKRVPVVLKADDKISDELLHLARAYAIEAGFGIVRLDSSRANEDAATPLSSGLTSPVSKPAHIPSKR